MTIDLDPKPLIYIAGPYSNPDPVLNTHNAIHVAERVEKLGAAVLIPHLSLLWHAVSPAEVDVWYERDLYMLAHCDGLLRFPGASSGADKEVAYAEQIGLPVFYDDLLHDDGEAHDEEGEVYLGWEALIKWIGWCGGKVAPS